MLTCNECLVEKDEEEFPLNKQIYFKDTKTYGRHTTCKKCKFARSKYRWNEQQRGIHKDVFKCKEAKSRGKYTMERFDSEGSSVVGWNGSDEIFM
jgi:hypothetical protein